jgi:hypothetical protein
MGLRAVDFLEVCAPARQRIEALIKRIDDDERRRASPKA